MKYVKKYFLRKVSLKQKDVVNSLSLKREGDKWMLVGDHGGEIKNGD